MLNKPDNRRRDLLKSAAGLAAGVTLGGLVSKESVAATHANSLSSNHQNAESAEAIALEKKMNDGPWKIAFEEHFITPTFNDLPSGMTATSIGKVYKELLETGKPRIDLMDQAKIQYSILSLNSPGIQAEVDGSLSRVKAMKVNDELKEIISKNPKRLGGFAALPTQSGEASAKELERCVKDLGFHGAMINSFANKDKENAIYLDDPQYDVLWDMAEKLNVPIYLHPRNPLESQQMMFNGHPELLAATWAFLVECSTHALRMISSGIFDRYPKLNVCLGHLGEALPAYQWRITKTYSQKKPHSPLKKDIYGYLKSNFYFTTSGFFDTKATMNVADIVGNERVCFASDHPWMEMTDAGHWFDNAQIDSKIKMMIGRENAMKLFNLNLD